MSWIAQKSQKKYSYIASESLMQELSTSGKKTRVVAKVKNYVDLEDHADQKTSEIMNVV